MAGLHDMNRGWSGLAIVFSATGLVGCGCTTSSAPPHAVVSEPLSGCVDRSVTTWVDPPAERGICTMVRQCVETHGQVVGLLSAPADNCGYPPATWNCRNCGSETIRIEHIFVLLPGSDGAWTYDLADELAMVPPGERRRLELHLREGRYEARTIILRGTERETLHASFEILPAREVIEGPESDSGHLSAVHVVRLDGRRMGSVSNTAGT